MDMLMEHTAMLFQVLGIVILGSGLLLSVTGRSGLARRGLSKYWSDQPCIVGRSTKGRPWRPPFLCSGHPLSPHAPLLTALPIIDWKNVNFSSKQPNLIRAPGLHGGYFNF